MWDSKYLNTLDTATTSWKNWTYIVQLILECSGNVGSKGSIQSTYQIVIRTHTSWCATPSSHTACLELQYDDYGQSFRNPLGTHADNESQDKRITGDCGGCKRFRIQAHQSPPPGNLPSTKNQGITPFEVPSVDFAGPAIPYRTKGKAARKVYLALYTWSLKRVPYHPKIQYLW